MPPWVTIGYVTFLLFPHHQPDPHVPRLPALPHQVLKGLYSNTYEGKNIQFPVSAEPCTPRCQEKGNENNHREDVLILLTLGNRKKKRLATEGWNTCYWIIVAFNVAPLQVLKGFSVLVPFCTYLENNLQKRAVLARTSWFPRIKKKKKKEFHLINLIHFLYLPSLTPLSRPFFSKLFCFAICYW